MNNFYEQFKNEAQKMRMTPAEKSAMKARVLGVHSPVATSTASPYFFFNVQFMQRTLVPALAVLVILLGSGTAYAAEGSMPGDALYAVKINVTEPLQTAFAVNAETRAEVHIALAERRVEEAEALASKGELTTTTTQELQDNFDAHVAEADALALEVGHNDPAAAVELAARANSSLSVHGALLAALGGDSTSSDTKQNSARLAARVLARVAVASNAPATTRATAALKTATVAPQAQGTGEVQTFAAAPAQSNETTTATPPAEPTPAPRQADTSGSDTANEDHGSGDSENSKLHVRAEQALKAARDQFADIKKKLSGDTANEVSAQLDQAGKLLSIDAQSSLELSLKLAAILKAQIKYRGDVVTPLLQLRFGGNND